MGTHDLGNGCKAAMQPSAHKVKFLREAIVSIWGTYEKVGHKMNSLIVHGWEWRIRELGEQLQRLEY